MDVARILAELRRDRERVDEAIVSLEQLVRNRGPRRGKPPAWMAALTTKRRGRPPGSKKKKKTSLSN
jgi:hypothetical protein